MNIANFIFTYINFFIFALIIFIKCIINVIHLNIVIMFTYLICVCLYTDCAVHGEVRGLVEELVQLVPASTLCIPRMKLSLSGLEASPPLSHLTSVIIRS